MFKGKTKLQPMTMKSLKSSINGGNTLISE